MRVHAIDVGQGAASLYEFSCGVILVDTGGETNGLFDSRSALEGYLDAFFGGRPDLDRTIDLLVLSHPHVDHTRNVRFLTEEFTVKNVITNGAITGSGGRQQKWLQEWAATNAHFEAIDGSRIPAGGRTSPVIDPIACPDQDPKVSVLWGRLPTPPSTWPASAQNDANNHSVVLRIDFGTSSFLTSGDLEVEAIEELIKKHGQTTGLDADVWQVSHHGSANGITAGLLGQMTPAMVFLSTGSEQREVSFSAWAHGHPRQQVVAALAGSVTLTRQPTTKPVATGQETFVDESISAAIFATGWDGSIVIEADNRDGYSVQTER